MDGWMDGWMGGWVDGWMVGRIDPSIDPFGSLSLENPDQSTIEFYNDILV